MKIWRRSSGVRFSAFPPLQFEKICYNNKSSSKGCLPVGRYNFITWACSAAGSASHSHCGGRRFESDQVHLYHLERLASGGFLSAFCHF